MFEISTSTSLFGNNEKQDILKSESQELKEYERYVENKYKLIPKPAPQPNEESNLLNDSKQKVPQNKAPAKNHEIIKGSTGSKIFALLQGIKPNALNRSVPQVDAPKKKDNGQPKRKLSL